MSFWLLVSNLIKALQTKNQVHWTNAVRAKSQKSNLHSGVWYVKKFEISLTIFILLPCDVKWQYPPRKLFMWWNFKTKVKAFLENGFSSLQLNLKFYQHFGVGTLYNWLIIWIFYFNIVIHYLEPLPSGIVILWDETLKYVEDNFIFEVRMMINTAI